MLDSTLNALQSAATQGTLGVTLGDTPRSKSLAPKAWPKWYIMWTCVFTLSIVL
jgi:hypothetical protein